MSFSMTFRDLFKAIFTRSNFHYQSTTAFIHQLFVPIIKEKI